MDLTMLAIIKKLIGSSSGSGSGGTTSYNNLDNLPEINGVTLVGSKTASDLNLKMSDILVTANGDKESGYNLDKTFTEIKELIDAGYNVKVKVPDSSMICEIFSVSSFSIVWQSYIGLDFWNINVTKNDFVSYTKGTTKACPYGYGGIMADDKTDEYTSDARIGADGRLYVKPTEIETTDKVEKDNTLPVTSAGVYTVCGNIEALLQAL